MDRDVIAEIGIDDKGQLYVTPRTMTFPHIYREAMEVNWDVAGHYLHAPPPPRGQLESQTWWLRRILAAAKEQNCELHIAQETRWHNIPSSLKEELLSNLPSLPNHLCPLCGGANQCAPAQAGRLDVECWCTKASISPAALARVPKELIDKACLCPRCAAGLNEIDPARS